ncbi:hypothetical protein FOA52_006139 [Chlamydomonas sp. UWO 241]|nr:hypothetical protein FOA52_006139 [Chlamydomonas sp. UWO 241]
MADDAAAGIRKVYTHILPLVCLVGALCYIDRTNLAFASLTMTRELQFSPTVYGTGSGLFFLGYSLSMIPSQLIGLRVGVSRWLGILVAVWGLVASCFALVRTAGQFYALRFLLGVAEAGAFPAIWYYLYLMLPKNALTLPYSAMETSVQAATVMSAPLAFLLLLLDSHLGLSGWQWMFVLEGVTTLCLGTLTGIVLPRGVLHARFLSEAQKGAIQQQQQQQQQGQQQQQQGQGQQHQHQHQGQHRGQQQQQGQRQQHQQQGHQQRQQQQQQQQGRGGGGGGGGGGGDGDAAAQLTSAALLKEALSDSRVWYIASMGLLKNVAADAMIFWLPIIVEGLVVAHAGATNVGVGGLLPSINGSSSSDTPGDIAAGTAAPATSAAASPSSVHDSSVAVLLSSLPFVAAAGFSLALGRSSQRAGERSLHLAIPYATASALMAALPLIMRVSGTAALFTLCAIIASAIGSNCVINACVPAFAVPRSVSVAMAFYNSFANLGGVLGPWLVGVVVESTGSYDLALWLLGGFMAAAAGMAWNMQRWEVAHWYTLVSLPAGPAGGAQGSRPMRRIPTPT